MNDLLSGLFAMEPSALQALIARLGNITGAAPVLHASGDSLTRSGTTSVIGVTGTIMPTDSPLLRFIGGTSIDQIRAGLRTALADGGTERIVLNVDSPGGSVTGVSELADEIFASRTRKPIIAYVPGMAASAAYWLASATQRIVTADTGLLGSIGVASIAYDDRALLDRVGVRRHEIVSSQSPRKRPDPATDAGRAQIQKMVDDLAGVFVSKVARHRGTTATTVLNRFGQGDMMVGSGAVSAGLADAVGTLADAWREAPRTSGRAPLAAPASSAHRASRDQP